MVDMTGVAPQLGFGLDNPDAPGTIYVSTDPADNQLTLSMSATAAARFAPGTLVPPSDAVGASGALLYLDLTPLGLSAEAFARLALVAEGWLSACYSDATGQYLGFTPIDAVTLEPGATITLALTGFTLGAQPGASASLTVLSYRVTGITSGNFPFASNIAVVFVVPDDAQGELTAAIAVALTPMQVVQSIDGSPTIRNQIALTLTHQPNAPTVNAGSDTAFVLSFVYATDPNGYGALLTTDQGQAIEVTAGAGATGWSIIPNLATSTPSWTLKPHAGSPIFGSGAASTLAFEIAALVTTFQPGPTVVLLGYSGVPGFKNGSFAVTLLKEPHVRISSFTVDPAQAVLDDGRATVLLAWQVSYATRLTLQPPPKPHGSGDVTGLTSVTATITDSTEFVLVAEGQQPANADNVASAGVVAQVLPVINGFSATPPSIYVEDFDGGYPTTLAWNVATTDDVRLSSSVSGPIGATYPPVDALSFACTTPQMLTLRPQGHPDDPIVARSLVLSGFDMVPAQVRTGHDSGNVAFPPGADFVAVSAPSEGLVVILSTATFQPLTTVPVGDNPNGIAFSPDGTLLYVANTGNGTVGIYAVASSESAVPFTFDSLATLDVGGAPGDVVVASDGTAYATVSIPGADGQVAVIVNDAGRFTLGAPVAVEHGPVPIAIAPGGTALYVGNTESNSISLVALGDVPRASTILTGIGGPQSLAVSPDGATLFVAAAYDNMVYAYDLRSPTRSRDSYPLGWACGVAAFASGGYAVAIGYSPMTVVLIDLARKRIAASRSLGQSPYGIAVAPEGGIAVAALPRSGAIEVITFARYARAAVTSDLGGQVTDVAVTPDNKTLLAWCNAAVPGTSSPMTGIAQVPVSGFGIWSYLQGSRFNAVAIAPLVEQGVFFAAPAGVARIDVYTLADMACIATIPIVGAVAPDRQAVALGVAGDGATVFALTDDGGGRFSLVAVAVDPAHERFAVVADSFAFATATAPTAYPFAVAPAGAGHAAYAVDPGTASLWSLAGSGNSWNTREYGALAPGMDPPPTVSALAVAPDGSIAYATMRFRTAVYVAAVTLAAGTTVLTRLPDSADVIDPTGLALSPDGRALYASDAAAAAIRIFDAASMRIDQTLTWQGGVVGPRGIAAASDGSGIFTANHGSANLAIAQQVWPG